MPKPIRVLIVEDMEDDALLVVRELERGGFNPTYELVETESAMTAALESKEWDLILSDYAMPQFNAMGAIKVWRKTGAHLPFIIISGTIGEDTAVEAMRLGVHDYLMKDKLKRLCPAVERELRDADVRRRRMRAEEALRESEERFRTIFDSANDGILLAEKEGKKFHLGNQAICKMLGYGEDEIKETGVIDIHPEQSLPHVIEQFEKQARREITVAEDIPVKRKDGSIFYADINTALIELSGKTYLMGIFRDVTDRKEAEKKVLQSLQEKEVLLREVHHRVKNNLQVISSMLSLQSRKIKGTPEADLLQESRSRIQTMAQIHESLYRSTDLRHVNLEDYITSISRNLFRMNKADASRVRLDIDIASVLLEIQQAIPCGMIINELLSNSLSHAFSKRKKGKINIHLFEEKDRFILSYEDNGIGFPEGFTPESSDTLGMKLVKTFVHQLRGDLEYESKDGVQFKIVFSRLKEKSNV
jgi:PAS domain S-box-containing protein